MKKLSKREDAVRKLRSLKKHLQFLLQPTIFAVLVTAIWWKVFHKNEIHFGKEDEVAVLAGVFLFLSVAYGITISTSLESVWGKYQIVVKSVLKKDKDTFLCYRDERLPIIVHLLNLAFSSLILLMVAMIEYHTISSGLLSVFSASFVLSLYFVVVTELQNPAKSLWFAERIPADWLTEDIDDYFKLNEEKKDPK